MEWNDLADQVLVGHVADRLRAHQQGRDVRIHVLRNAKSDLRSRSTPRTRSSATGYEAGLGMIADAAFHVAELVDA